MSLTGLKGVHYMIDLETLSVCTNSIITSIGIVEFDMLTGKCGREYYQTIDLDSCMKIGLEINAETLTWWLIQPDKVRLEINKKGSKDIKIVLEEVTNFLKSSGVTNSDKFFVWGNGSSFDLGILANAFLKCEMERPWKFYNERDVRTIVALYPEIKNVIDNKGDKHHPIDDCKYQIQYCTNIIKTLYGLKH